MATQYTSKHGIIGKSPAELFMGFTDMRNFQRVAPTDQKVLIEADYDTLSVTAQGFTISAKVARRIPYNLIEIVDENAPFGFDVQLHFDDGGAGKTDFWIEVSAELNGMLKIMLGGKIKQALDKAVDTLAEASAKI